MKPLLKPDYIFDRSHEWSGLESFARYEHDRAALGVVSGRRRQGKSYLLQALAEAAGGFYFAATEATEAESLRMFTEALAQHIGIPVEPEFRDWNDAIRRLFKSFTGEPTVVVIDEFPFLSRVSPSLPSIIQRELGPGGTGQGSSVRLLLCGSAMSVMGRLLSGRAPLRGRAGLEIVVKPFGYQDAARFWNIDDPQLAFLVNAVVGGTPAYRTEFTRGDVPIDRNDFDDWIIRAILDPQTPIFREARYLLAEESDIRDPALYHSVLAAIAVGNSSNGGIAGYIGRRSDEVTHPLNVLEDCGLVSRELDLLRKGRPIYRIAEPLITFYEAIMRPGWSELEKLRPAKIWQSARPTFLARIAGPHFENLCREFAVIADTNLFGDPSAEVGAGIVNDPTRREQIQVDVVVFAMPEPGKPRRILSLGEAKYGERMGIRHVNRLYRARKLLADNGFDTRDTVLACYSGIGFNDDLTPDKDIRTIDFAQLYEQTPPG